MNGETFLNLLKVSIPGKRSIHYVEHIYAIPIKDVEIPGLSIKNCTASIVEEIEVDMN